VNPGKTNKRNKAAFGLQTFRCPNSEDLAHHQAQVARHGDNQVAFLHLLDPTKPTATGTPAVAHMGKASRCYSGMAAHSVAV